MSFAMLGSHLVKLFRAVKLQMTWDNQLSNSGHSWSSSNFPTRFIFTVAWNKNRHSAGRLWWQTIMHTSSGLATKLGTITPHLFEQCCWVGFCESIGEKVNCLFIQMGQWPIPKLRLLQSLCIYQLNKPVSHIYFSSFVNLLILWTILYCINSKSVQ